MATEDVRIAQAYRKVWPDSPLLPDTRHRMFLFWDYMKAPLEAEIASLKADNRRLEIALSNPLKPLTQNN